MRRGGVALGAAALAIVVALVAAACDRVVNLTPFYDGGPDPDAAPANGGLDAAHPAPDGRSGSDAGSLDAGVDDGNPTLDAAGLDSGLGLDGGLSEAGYQRDAGKALMMPILEAQASRRS